MILEERDAEAMALDGEFDIAIPFSFAVCDGEPEVKVFPTLRPEAEEFLRLFGGDADRLFSPEAIAWAKAHFAPFLERNGYTVCEESNGYFLNYRIEDPDRGCIQDSTRRISSVGALENLTGYDFDALESFGHICFATVVDGRVVSAACTNIPCECECEADCDETFSVEIGVETAPGYRGKGYGRSNAAALAAFLTDCGYEVLYECEADNASSAAVIEAVGGRLFARNYCIVGRMD